MKSIRGRNAVLTGASGGLGRQIGAVLAREGVNMALVGRDVQRLEASAGQFARGAVRVETFLADIADPAERRNLPLRIRGSFDEIDLLINAAGIEHYGRFADQSPAGIDETLGINLLAPLRLALDFLPDMLERKRGHIVNLTSLAGRLGMPFASIYAASKGALCNWSLSLSAELGGSGVGVSSICPAFVDESGMFARKHRSPPPVMGSVGVAAVGEAVLRAILDDVPEIIVSGWPARPLMALHAVSPRAASWTAARLGLVDYLRAIADGMPER